MITIDCPLCAGEATTDEALTILSPATAAASARRSRPIPCVALDAAA